MIDKTTKGDTGGLEKLKRQRRVGGNQVVDLSEIIDFEIRGRTVRFYLGKNGKQWGDDFNDAPYEHNAGTVYEEFVKSHVDVQFNFDDVVVEPCDGHANSRYSKQDMIERLVPCVVVLKADDVGDKFWRTDEFDAVLAHPKAIKYYFGDKLTDGNDLVKDSFKLTRSELKPQGEEKV